MKKMKHIKQKAKICSHQIKVFGIVPEEFESILKYKFDSQSDEEFLVRQLGLSELVRKEASLKD